MGGGSRFRISPYCIHTPGCQCVSHLKSFHLSYCRTDGIPLNDIRRGSRRVGARRTAKLI